LNRVGFKSTACKAILTGLLLALLTACGSAPAPTAASNSRYSIQQDRAPDRRTNPAAIPEVIPEPLNRTMAGNRSPYTVLGKSYNVMPTEEGYSERGVASWYGQKFHGHKTSNGEVFDMYLASAAHKSLPIPSFLRVTNLDNNRSIVVRVNDRGPFHGDRIVDLSYAAALKLGYADQGTARVQLDAIVVSGAHTDRAVSSRASSARWNSSRINRQSISSSSNGSNAKQYLQVGAFAELSAARDVSRRLQALTNRPVFIRSVNSQADGILHRVRVGPINDPTEIRRISQSVVAANLGSPYTVSE